MDWHWPSFAVGYVVGLTVWVLLTAWLHGAHGPRTPREETPIDFD